MSGGSFENRNGTWSVRYRDTTGRQLRRSGFRSKGEASKWLANRQREQRDGIRHDKTLTFRKLGDLYLEQHAASPARITKLRFMLKLAYTEFGDTLVSELTGPAIGAWRNTLSEGTRHDALAAVKQVLRAAVEFKYIASSPADSLKNPVPLRSEAMPFEDWPEIASIEAVIHPAYEGLATFVVGTGLRPQEWTKLRWEHIDFRNRAINLPAQVAKGKRSRRIPLRQVAIAAIEHRRERTGLVFATATGKPIELHSFRNRVWSKALGDAGVACRRPYDMRHTYATWALRAGVSTFMLARRMGTSIQMIEETYGHFTTDSEDYELRLLDAYDAGCVVTDLVTPALNMTPR